MRTASAALLMGMFGCSLFQSISPVTAAGYREKILHSFGGAGDGVEPYAGMINVKATLYGTTFGGGDAEGGTVFSLDPRTGAEAVIHSFGGANNGANPVSSLINVKGTLYGTTAGGDVSQTLFSIDLATGSEQTVYTFCSQGNCADGYGPNGLLDMDGTLYGTTGAGGSNSDACSGLGCGVIFSVNRKTGKEKVLYSFCSQPNCSDGSIPLAGVIDVNGVLYGTTSVGGASGSAACNGNGCGTVFSFDPATGVEKAVYSFCGQAKCSDGANPYASLIDVNGTLYGTTKDGGALGEGTVFAINPDTGAETVVYSFCSQANCADGTNPVANLIAVNGILYGTATKGGSAKGGTAFAIDPGTGVETVLHSFCSQQSCTDGSFPQGSLTAVGGKLYGTTTFGGSETSCNGGCGTAYVLKQKH